MTGRIGRSAFLFSLALVFTAGLTFASIELPYLVDGLVQGSVPAIDVDTHSDAVTAVKTELFMAHYHVRALGYVGFFALMGLIVLGFTTRWTGLAALGAVGVMLPVFAQFAGVMFFLAGLGVLNSLWLPVLDLTWGIQDWGLVVRAPADLLRWLLELVGLESFWTTVVFFTASGILFFLLGSWAWLTARARGRGVADFWVYRISRHPQYLGWILWTYGAFLLIQRMHYPKRSWGIGASLPWLLSTMVIIGVALMEELKMRREHGEAYEAYRRSAPFLFPLPGAVEGLFALPFRIFYGRSRPERPRQIVVVLALYTGLLMALSALFYAGGMRDIRWALTSPLERQERAWALKEELEAETYHRRVFHLTGELARMGEAALDPLLDLLEGENHALRIQAAEAFSMNPDPRAVPALLRAVEDPDENLRSPAMWALVGAGPPELEGILDELLEDPAGHIRVGALETLARMGADTVLAVAPLFMSQDPWIRASTMDALGSLGSKRALPLLEVGLRDESTWVRRHAAIALLRLGTADARPALEEALEDQDFEVRLYATEALERLPRG